MSKRTSFRSLAREVPFLRSIVLSKNVWRVCIILPIILLILLVVWGGVHVAFWDQWEFVELLKHHTQHTLGWGDFWVQHNEHRLLFPRLIMYGLALVTQWDPYYELFVNVGLAIVSLIVLLKVIREQCVSRLLLISQSVVVAWLLMSPLQWENWLWGWQIQWFLSVLAVIGCLWFLTHTLSMKTMLAAMGCALIATYSLANGFTVWGIGVLILILRVRVKRLYALILALTGFLATALHYYHYVNPAYHPSKTLFLHHPKAFVHYCLVYIGRPLSYDIHHAPWVGLVLVVVMGVSLLYLWFRQRSIFRKLLLWVGLACYGVAGAVLTAISRLGLGIDQSYSSRYTTISSLFVAATTVIATTAVYVYATEHTFSDIRRRLLVYSVVIPVFVMIIVNYGKGGLQAGRQHYYLVDVRNCLEHATSAKDPCLLMAYPNAEVVWQRLEFLRAHNLGGL